MIDESHPFFRTFAALMTEAAEHAPVYDLGTNKRFAKQVGIVRNLFDESRYFAAGYQSQQGIPDACDFDFDIQDMQAIADGQAGSVLCMSVLEHLPSPARAVKEMARILRPGGIAIVSVPFFISYHGKAHSMDNPVFARGTPVPVDPRHEYYSDFWRFTHEGLALLFSDADFSRVDIFPVDGRLISRMQITGLYQVASRIPGLIPLLAKFDRPRLGKMTSMHFVRAEK